MKDFFNKIIKMKQTKIIGLANNICSSSTSKADLREKVSLIKFYSKPWSNISHSNEVNLPREVGDINIENSIHQETAEVSYSYDIEIGFKIKYDINSSTKINNDCIDSFFLAANIRNQTYLNLNIKDNIGWFYGTKIDNSLILGSKLKQTTQIIDNISKDDFLIKRNINNEINEFRSTMLLQPLNIISYLKQYVTLNKGDIILTGGIGNSYELQNENNIFHEIEFGNEENKITDSLRIKVSIV